MLPFRIRALERQGPHGSPHRLSSTLPRDTRSFTAQPGSSSVSFAMCRPLLGGGLLKSLLENTRFLFSLPSLEPWECSRHLCCTHLSCTHVGAPSHPREGPRPAKALRLHFHRARPRSWGSQVTAATSARHTGFFLTRVSGSEINPQTCASLTFQGDVSIIMSKYDSLESVSSLIRSRLFPKCSATDVQVKTIRLIICCITFTGCQMKTDFFSSVIHLQLNLEYTLWPVLMQNVYFTVSEYTGLTFSKENALSSLH